MRWVSAMSLRLLLSSVPHGTRLKFLLDEVSCMVSPRLIGVSMYPCLSSLKSPFPCSLFYSVKVDSPLPKSSFDTPDSTVFCSKDEADVSQVPWNSVDDDLARSVTAILNILQAPGAEPAERKVKIEQSGVKVSKELVLEVFSRVRNDWEAAYSFFLWAGRQHGYSHSTREYHSMIAILGKMKKFDTAWSLISEMRRKGPDGSSLVTPQTLLIMIRKFCAAHDVGKAINAFYAHKRFNFVVGMEQFHGLLSALCKYKNVQDAEHLMHCNKNAFPLNTKSFNIILNGWCNVIGSPKEGERMWRQMRELGINFDVVSCSTMISCYSKTGSLYRVLKLYDIMKDNGVEPNRKVYNAIIHALAKGRKVKQAMNLIQTMEGKGIHPDSVTYNSLIKPLCTAGKVDEASTAFDEMLSRGISPTLRTFHAFFHVLRTKEEVLALLERMKTFSCQPTQETYIMVIRKFCRWRLLDDVSRLWTEMKEVGISHDRSAYSALIYGYFLNGELELAYKYYMEMKKKDLLPEPSMDKLLQTWFAEKQKTDIQLKKLRPNELDENELQVKTSSSDSPNEQNFLKNFETRKVERHRGFSILGK